MTDIQDLKREALTSLSTQDFLAFGLHHIAYIKPLAEDGKESYALHAADGALLAVQDDLNAAAAMAYDSNLKMAILH